MCEVGQLFYERKPACNTECLSEKLQVDGEMLEPVLNMLEQKHYLERLEDLEGAFLPAVPLDAAMVAKLIEDIWSSGDTVHLPEQNIYTNETALAVMKQDAIARRAAFEGQTLKDLVMNKMDGGPS
jgi:hypothetical protein